MQAVTGQAKPIILFSIHSEANKQPPLLLKIIIVFEPN